MSDDIFEDQGTDADNTAKRVPVALCLDTSGSMCNDIDDLNAAVQQFYKECRQDSKAKNAVEVISVEFGGGVNIASQFSEVEYAQIPLFSASGDTPMGEAVGHALNALEQRKEWYKDEGIAYFQPMLVLMTDGGATDDIASSAARAADMVNNKKLTVIPLAFGGQADITTLESFSSGQIRAIPIGQKFSFIEFFKWLSASASAMTTGKDIDFTKFQDN